MLNLGGLFFTLDADTRGLGSAARQVTDFARTVDRAFRGVANAQVDSKFANSLLKQERAVVQMLERVKNLQDQINRSSVSGRPAANLLGELNAAYSDFTRRMTKGVPLNTAEFSRNIQHMQSQLRDTQREFTNLNNAATRNAKGVMSFTGVLQGLGGASLLIQGHLGGMSTRFFALTGLVREFGFVAAATAASVAGLSAGFSLLAVGAVKAGRELQGLEVAFKAVTGNAAVAQTQLTYVRKVADLAGVGFADAAKGYMRFLASAQVGGLTLKQTQDAFTGMTLAAATMQLSTEDMQGVFRALDQMMSKGTVQAEELRGQLGDRLPGAFQIAAVAMGVTTAKLGDMMKKGDVLSSEFVPKFVAAVQRMWGIDPSKPINTLTASLNRLSNEWTYFSQSLDKATGASRTFKMVVDNLIQGMQWMSQNLETVIGLLGAATGAFIGLGVAMAVTSLIQWVGTMGALANWIQIVIRSTNLWTAAQVFLNAAMAAFPLTRIITILLTLAAAITGAVVGYNLLTSAVQQNNAALSNTSAIESYIAQQKKMGFAVRSTTEEMLKQVMVMGKVANEAATKAGLEAAKNAKPGAGDYVVGAIGTVLTDWGFKGLNTNPSDISGARMDKANKEAAEAIAESRRLANLYTELQDLMKLPEPPAIGGLGGGKGDKPKKMSDQINQVEDYILRMTRAEEKLRELSAGNRDYKMVDDLYKAKEALNQLNPKQIANVNQALIAAGYSSGSLEARLGAVFTRTREAEEAARTFAQVWDDIKQGTINLTNLNKQLDYIRGGGDPKMLASFEAYARASDMLRDINPNSVAGQNALKGLQEQLRSVGVELADTGDLTENVRLQLAAFFQQEDQGGQLVRVFTDLHEEMTRTKDRLTELQALTSLAGGRGIGDLFGGDNGGREVSAALKRGQAVRELIRDMQAAGATQEEINQKSSAYLELLRQVDSAEIAYDRLTEKTTRARDSLRDMANAGVDAFQDIVRGVSSVGEALTDLSNNILDSLWKQFINAPIDDFLNGLGRAKDKSAASGLDSAVAGLAANDNTAATTAIGSLAASAQAAAGAVGGNFLNSIVSGALQITTKTSAEVMATTGLYGLATAATAATGALAAMAASSVANSASASLATIGSSIFKAATGRAIGGPMSAGTMYQVNEPGVTGEYFIPSVNGYMSPNSQLEGQVGGQTLIDMSTTIDARGATRDAIADLERKMAERDARLIQQLPFIVDARVRDSSARRRYG